ncbi:hypothetical protein B6U84_06565, partial [Candidatus Bathyarchaeota archaeon ex4484_40]
LVRVEDLTDEEAKKFGLGFWQLFKNADKHDGKLLLLANIAEKTTGKKAEAWNRLMDNAQFRSHAVENVENFETQAWLANTLFGGQDESYVEGIDSLFKAEAKPARLPEVEGPMSTRILEHLKTGPKTWSQLMELGPKSTVGSAIKRLVRSGRIVKVKRGLYSLPAQSPAGRLLEYVADGPKPRSQLINNLMRDFGLSKAAASNLIRRSVEEYKLVKAGKGMYGLPPSREGMEVVRSKMPDGGVLTYVKPPSWAEIKPPTETQSRILKALKDQPKTAKQLTAELGLKKSRVEADLRSLYLTGRVAKMHPAKGREVRYTLPPTEPEAPPAPSAPPTPPPPQPPEEAAPTPPPQPPKPVEEAQPPKLKPTAPRAEVQPPTPPGTVKVADLTLPRELAENLARGKMVTPKTEAEREILQRLYEDGKVMINEGRKTRYQALKELREELNRQLESSRRGEGGEEGGEAGVAEPPREEEERRKEKRQKLFEGMGGAGTLGDYIQFRKGYSRASRKAFMKQLTKKYREKKSAEEESD